jgi:hypothetical protein
MNALKRETNMRHYSVCPRHTPLPWCLLKATFLWRNVDVKGYALILLAHETVTCRVGNLMNVLKYYVCWKERLCVFVTASWRHSIKLRISLLWFAMFLTPVFSLTILEFINAFAFLKHNDYVYPIKMSWIRTEITWKGGGLWFCLHCCVPVSGIPSLFCLFHKMCKQNMQYGSYARRLKFSPSRVVKRHWLEAEQPVAGV